MPPLKITHFFTEYYSLGGVQAVLKHHHQNDPDWDLDSNFVIYSETEREPVSRVNFLGYTGKTTLCQARQKLINLRGEGSPDIAAFHGMWGLANLADLDHAKRRILVLHGESPPLKRFIHNKWTWVDGIFCVSRPLQRLVRSYAPKIAPERIGLLPYPISPMITESPRSARQGRPLVIGFCSRVQFEQKRADRLPALLQLLDKTGVNYRFEVLGDGSHLGWLQEQLEGNPNVKYHGRQNGLAYWQILNSWDVSVLVSDYEGLPIALLEALSLGVIPVYPDIGTGGDEYAREISPSLVFPAGDMAKAAEILANLGRVTDEEIETLRQRSRAIAAPHMNDGYMETFSKFCRFIMDSPAIALKEIPRGNSIFDHCPHNLVTKGNYLRDKFQDLLGKKPVVASAAR